MNEENESEKTEGAGDKNFRFPEEGNAEESTHEPLEQKPVDEDQSWYEALKARYREKSDEELLRLSTFKDADAARESQIKGVVLTETNNGLNYEMLDESTEDFRESNRVRLDKWRKRYPNYSFIYTGKPATSFDHETGQIIVNKNIKPNERTRFATKGNIVKQDLKGFVSDFLPVPWGHGNTHYSVDGNSMSEIMRYGDAPKELIDAVLEFPDKNVVMAAVENNRVTAEQLGRFFSMMTEEAQFKVAPFWIEKQEALGMHKEDIKQALEIAQQKRQDKKRVKQKDTEPGKEGA